MGARTRWVTALLLLSLAACKDDGPNEGRETRPGSPVYDEPLGQNERFSFTPGPPGSYPGLRVEIEVDGQVYQSEELEILMREWDGVTTIERPLATAQQAQFARLPSLGLDERLEEAILQGAGRTEPLPPLDEIRIELAQPLATDRQPRSPDQIFDEQLARIARNVEAAMSTEGQKNIACPPGTRAPWTAHEKIGSFGHVTFWMALTFGFSTGVSEAYAWAVHFAPEGIYMTLQESFGAQVIPSVGISATSGIGFLVDRETRSTQRFSAGTIEGKSYSISFNFLAQQMVLTWGSRDEGGLHTGLQWDVGTGFSLPIEALFGFLSTFLTLPINVGVAEAKVSTRLIEDRPTFVFMTGYDSDCSAPMTATTPAEALSTAAEGEEVFQRLMNELDRMQQSAEDRDDPVLSALADQVARSMRPVIERQSRRGGAEPDTGIGPGTNGDASSDWVRRTSSQELCPECPATTIEGFTNQTFGNFSAAGDDPAAIMDAAIEAAAQSSETLPQQELFASQTAQIAGAVDGAFALAYEYAADPDEPNRYVSDAIVDIDVRAGEPAYFEFTAQEIADLIGRPVEDVDGATICIQADFGGPRLEDSCVVLEDEFINGTLTFENVTQLLFYADVDLSTAAGDFPEDVADWTVRPALRRARVAPGPVARVQLTGTQSIYGGAPATLNASVVDEFGNIISLPITFRFLDADGNVVHESTSEDGLATWQFQPPRSTPAISSIEATTFVDGEGNNYPGFAVVGERMSVAATLLVDGRPVTELGWQTGTITSREFYVVAADATTLQELGLGAPTPIPSGATIVLVNPGDLRSTELRWP